MLGSTLTKAQKGILKYTHGPDIESKAIADDDLDSVFDPLSVEILRNYRSSGKIVRFLDANPKDNPEIAEREDQRFELVRDINRRINHNDDITIGDVLSAERLYRELFGQNCADRNKVINQQVEKYVSQFGDKKIVVVYGSSHTPISYDWLRSGRATRKFVESSVKPGAKVFYGVSGEIGRRVEFGKPIPEDLVIRSLLYSSLLGLLASRKGRTFSYEQPNDILNFEYDLEEYDPLVDTVVRKISSSDLGKYLELSEAGLKVKSAESSNELNEFLGSLIDRTRDELESSTTPD